MTFSLQYVFVGGTPLTPRPWVLDSEGDVCFESCLHCFDGKVRHNGMMVDKRVRLGIESHDASGFINRGLLELLCQ